MRSFPSSLGTGPHPCLVGLAGRGIGQSRTPWMHEQEGDAQGLRLAYSLFDFTAQGWADADLARLLDSAQMLGFAGLNITFPFKQAVIPLLDELDEAALKVGAVNTVAFHGGRRIGRNTDIGGFAAGFRAGLPGAALGQVLQIGCGGAGAATAHALLGMLGAERILLHDADASRAGLLGEQLRTSYGEGRVLLCDDLMHGARQADGIINATPMGMAKFPGSPIAADGIEPRHWVADIVYFPLETELLRLARHKGCTALDGSGMAVHQAAEAFAIFTGQPADRARMAGSFAAYTAPAPIAAE